METACFNYIMLKSCVLTSVLLEVFLILISMALRVMLLQAGRVQIFFVASVKLRSIISYPGKMQSNCDRESYKD